MLSNQDILRRLDRGDDPELDKLVNKRADELGITRLEALALLLRKDEGE